MTPTINAAAHVPDRHLATTILANGGVYWLYGYHGHDLTARFTLVFDGQTSADDTVDLDNADWTATWNFLTRCPGCRDVEGTIRGVLPPVGYKPL